jgi:hypothetical protein
MGKVVTGAGMVDFVQNGTVENIKSDRRPKRPPPAPALEIVPDKPVIELSKPAENAPLENPKVDEESGLEVGDEDLAERVQARINKKHREMKQAQALAERLREESNDNETFAKNQFDRARMAEEKLATLERELAELRGKAVTVTETAKSKKPDAKEFMDEQGQFKAFEYAEALAKFSATEAVEEDRKRQREEATQASQAEAVKAFEARLEKAREKYPDFKEVVGRDDTIVPSYVQQYMVRSPYGADLGYWFAKNPVEAKRIFAMEPILAIAELGEIQTQWKKPAEIAAPVTPLVPALPKNGGAPAPIVPLQSQASAQINTDPARMNFQELRAFRREEARNKQRR